MNPPFNLHVPTILKEHPRAGKLACMREVTYEDFKAIGNSVEKTTGAVVTEDQVVKALHTCADKLAKTRRKAGMTPEMKRTLFEESLESVVRKQLKRKPW